MSVLAPAVRHVAVESTRLLQERRGIGRYVRNVVREMARQRPTLRFTFFVKHARETEAMRAYLEQLDGTLNARTWVEPVTQLPGCDADVVWYPWNFVTTPSRNATMVATVHDVAPMLRLDHRWWKVIKRAKHRMLYRRTLDRAHAVVTVSSFSRDELVSKLHADPSNITVTLLAADDVPVHLGDDDAPLRRAGITGPFFLVVGGQDARKNLVTLYDAMRRAWASGLRTPLVQCGPAPSRSTRARLERTPWFRHVGYVTEMQLATLYRRCTALVCPSRYEGFGLPVAEAMRMGAPVICTDVSSLPEVAGSAAHFVAWNDAACMAEALQELAVNETRRDLLRNAGRERAALLTWSATARETLVAFERAIERRGVVSIARANDALVAAKSPLTSAPLAASAVIAAAPGLHRTHDA